MSMVFFPSMMIKKILVFWDCVRNSYELMLCCWSRKKKEKNINFTVVCLSLSIMVLFHYYVCLSVFHLFKVMLSKFIAIPQKTQKQTYWYEFKRTNQGWGILPKCTNLIKKIIWSNIYSSFPNQYWNYFNFWCLNSSNSSNILASTWVTWHDKGVAVRSLLLCQFCFRYLQHTWILEFKLF